MVETAAHLADHVIARLPLRQWVLSVPKRLRYHLERDPAVLNAALHFLAAAAAMPLNLLRRQTTRLARRGRVVPVATRAAKFRRPGGHSHTQWACRGGVSAACQASSAPNQRLTLTDMAGLLQQWR